MHGEDERHRADLRHRREVVTRRTVFELRKARERGHILEGLAVALSNVDEVIALLPRIAAMILGYTGPLNDPEVA